MLTRIQIKAKGTSALKVETELRDTITKIVENCGLEGRITQQVIEGTPGASFEGRLLFTVGFVREPCVERPKVRTAKVVLTGGEAA